jgi:hypothetical protein
MPTLHDADHRAQLARRVETLRPDSQHRWGKMSVDQMLWHVNGAMAAAVGELTLAPRRPPLPRPILKFMVLRMPWGKGAPTMPEFVAAESYDFQSEKARCLRLMNTLASTELNAEWPLHPLLGRMSGLEASGLQAKHLDHHLKQFGA